MPKPFTIQPNLPGSTLRMVTYELVPELDTFADMEAFAQDLDGSICGFMFDNERPELVTLQIEEGHPDVDLRWARRTMIDGLPVSRVVLEEQAGGACVYHGSASRDLSNPERYTFLLSFRGK